MVSVAGFVVDSAAAGGSIILACIERFLLCCVFRTGFHRWIVWFPSWQENVVYDFRRWLFNGFRLGKNVCLWFPSLFVLMVSGCYKTAAVSPMETVNINMCFRDELSIYIYIYIYILYIYT